MRWCGEREQGMGGEEVGGGGVKGVGEGPASQVRLEVLSTQRYSTLQIMRIL